MIIKILKVTGNSMHPTLESGAFVLLWQSAYLYKIPVHSRMSIQDKRSIRNKTLLYRKYRPSFLKHYFQCRLALKVGDIVAINHSKYGQIIKRVTRLNETAVHQTFGQSSHLQGIVHALRIAGDNKAASVNEAQMGWVQVDDVMGKVIYVFKK